MLFGRDHESMEIDRLLSAARDGRSGAIVLRGEAGIGKSALLDYAAAQASELQLLRGTGIEFEAELPFAGLHMLLRSELGRVDSLPGPQAQALGSALGLTAQPGGDRFLVGLAVLTLLAEIAEQGPVLCLIDDAHWLDRESAEALLFAARRLAVEGVVIIFAVRDLYAPTFLTPGLAELRLTPLDESAAAGVLTAHAADLPGYVRDHIRGQADGNPLALRELAAAQREGRLSADPLGIARLPTHSRIQRSFTDRITALPETTRTVLLVAAADDTRTTATVLAAAERLGASLTDLAVAEQRELLWVNDDRIGFRHPLIRAAAYQSALVNHRMDAHRALAAVLADPADALRHAWHLSAASTGPDEEVAAKLSAAAENAKKRGGYSAVAAGYERAAALSPLPHDRGRRLVHAAEAALDAGQLDQANLLADRAAKDLDDIVWLGRMTLVRSTVADWRGQLMTAHDILVEMALRAARHARDTGAVPLAGEPWDAAERELATRDDLTATSQDTASRLLFQAAEIAWIAGEFEAVAQAAKWAEEFQLRRAYRVGAMARVAVGLSGYAGADAGDGIAALHELLEMVGVDLDRKPPQSTATVLWWHLLLGDHETAHRVGVDLVARCRARGAVGVLPRALALLARAQYYRGDYPDALSNALEAVRIVEDISKNLVLVGVPTNILAQLAAVTGDEEGCRRLVSELSELDPGGGMLVIERVLALLDIGFGRYEAVVERLTRLLALKSRMDLTLYVPDLVEAAVRIGRPEVAVEPFAWFAAWAASVDQPWARGVAARCRALLDESGAETHFQAAEQADAQDGARPFEQARNALLYGEWLRRQRRPSDARPRFRLAVEIFERLGAKPWAERARLELRATGESVAGASSRPDRLSSLTPQELQVVRLASTGLTNRDIGAQLFLSPRTVGYHLYKAYPKLGVASRAELARLDLASN